MSELKIGDRVELIGDTCEKSINIGDRGIIISVGNVFMGVDFDKNIGGHSCAQRGRYGYRLYVPAKCLKKIEEAEEETAVNTEETEEEVNEETKTETMEQKILKVLREEIGVDIGEEFDVYEKGEKQWTCKFEETGFFHEIDDEFRESGFWKQIVCKFHSYQFKRKPFVPKHGEDYFFLADYDENKNMFFRVLQSTWIDSGVDYGMLALGNVFRNEEEALKGKDKLLERLKKLRKGEQI